MASDDENKNQLPGDITHFFDQFDTTLENTAKLMSTYYHSLIRNYVPYDLAIELVKDLNRQYFSQLGKAPKKDE